jgi:hypothetical protein
VLKQSDGDGQRGGREEITHHRGPAHLHRTKSWVFVDVKREEARKVYSESKGGKICSGKMRGVKIQGVRFVFCEVLEDIEIIWTITFVQRLSNK